MKSILKHFGGDKVIWVLLVILTVYSGLAASSSVVSLANNSGDPVAVQIIRHSAFLLGGWIIIYIAHLIPYKFYSIFALLLVVAAVLLLMLTLIKGQMVNQAHRWLDLGFGLSFQTSDFAKLALIIFVARYLSRNQAHIEDLKKGFLPVLAWIVIVCGLILPANLSTAVILFASCVILLFIGRVRTVYIGGLLGSGLVLVLVFFLIAKSLPDSGRAVTWEKRIESFFNGEEGDSFQSDLAKTAIANGGMFGKFAGHSTQKHSLPQAYSDFIFAIIIEEYGFLFGAVPLLFIYLTLLFRAGVIVKKCDRTFPAFLAIGLTIGLVLQAMVNMGVAVGLLPVTGQPLPWISRGGTSILFTALAFGIILGISRTLETPKEESANA